MDIFIKTPYDELLYACEIGNLVKVKFLIKNEGVDINQQDTHCLMVATAHGHLPIIDYLLTSFDISEPADIHAQEDKAFKFACIHEENNQAIKLLNYFIFERDIELTPEIQQFIFNKPDIRKMFEIRLRKRRLQRELKEKKHHAEKTKI